MVPLTACHPTISYRPIRPSDLEILEQLHGELFPIRYESEFFQNVVHGRGIVSWAAVDHSRDDGKSDELIGFVTARVVPAKDSEIVDLLNSNSAESEWSLVYILTLGVMNSYRNLGIASSLILEVIKYTSSIQTCQAVYLHVISYNIPAIHLYKKMSFKCIRKLPGFYLIDGQHYDSYLFVYFVKGSRSPCSPLELVMVVVRYIRIGFQSIIAKLWSDERKVGRWCRCKEAHSLI
ncbi:histone acetyltransferase MCC1 isoform X2 [Eucalyptus grandis]|uniref:histone acetyltransferase MCC1 isoform X2 n=1 Tax=Eucalyptus grandis TaxID=71139 RepID=UPI00192E7753|nr:histone acetyltransferase MCC1 isoform X2 [Eucalyptus grandis]